MLYTTVWFDKIMVHYNRGKRGKGVGEGPKWGSNYCEKINGGTLNFLETLRFFLTIKQSRVSHIQGGGGLLAG